MAYNYEYPYVDAQMGNADWIINKIKELDAKIDSFGDDILNKANAYTDLEITKRLADVNAEFAKFKAEVNAKIANLDSNYAAFVATVNARMVITEARLAEMNEQLQTILKESMDYTQYAINNNNAYIIDQTTKALSTVTVLNYFTGARTSIQDMFDYMAHFHLENAITCLQLANREKTVTQLIDYHMTMTDLATNGGTIIQA